MIFRSPTNISLSGDDRSGDSGVDSGGVRSGSAPASAASTRLTISFAAWIDLNGKSKR